MTCDNCKRAVPHFVWDKEIHEGGTFDGRKMILRRATVAVCYKCPTCGHVITTDGAEAVRLLEGTSHPEMITEIGEEKGEAQ